MEKEWTLPPFEAERYELYGPSVEPFTLERREFFRLLGCGILVLLVSPRGIAGRSAAGGAVQDGRPGTPRDVSSWLHVGEDGVVTVFTGKVEVGQNIRTSLSQVVAEEIRVPLASVRMVMGDTARTPYDAGTFGSRTTPVMSVQLRRAAAAAREHLLNLASRAWSVERDSLETAEGKVLHSASGRSASYGELTQGQAVRETINEDSALTVPNEWKVAGRSIPKVDGRAFVTGKHRYTSDLKLPATLVGKVLRAPAFGATLLEADTSEAEKIPGVRVVRDGDFVGLTALDETTAERALEAIQAEWKIEDQPSGKELFEYLKNRAGEGRGRASSHVAGSVEEGLKAARTTLRATYTVAYIAHAPLEPRAAVAQWEDGNLTAWTGTQRPFGVRSELASALGLPEDRVRVIVPDTGSGYGGKHTGETAVECARLAREAGLPVKLVWTREEEFTWAYFRPAGVIEVASGVDAEGKLTAWEFHNYNSGGSAIRTLYGVPHQRIEFHPTLSPLRQGSYRALAATANHFARESHMDELAHELGLDPLEFRLKNLKDPRLRAVLEAAAEKFGWARRQSSSGTGFGIAGGFEKGGYIATCAEVSADSRSRRVQIHRVVAAFECGAVINPDHLKSQIEGCIVMGLGGAFFEAVEFDSGKILNPRFSRYRVPRFSDLPPMEIVLLDRKDLPSAGAGETPIVGIAPALGNALFEATGKRLRSLPLLPQI